MIFAEIITEYSILYLVTPPSTTVNYCIKSFINKMTHVYLGMMEFVVSDSLIIKIHIT